MQYKLNLFAHFLYFTLMSVRERVRPCQKKINFHTSCSACIGLQHNSEILADKNVFKKSTLRKQLLQSRFGDRQNHVTMWMK